MPKKCESCRHFKPHPRFDAFERGWCTHVKIRRLTIYEMPGTPKPINEARQICDREHDGHFVYFKPRDPATGAAVDPDDIPEFCTDDITGNCSCSSCMERDRLAFAAGTRAPLPARTHAAGGAR